MSPTPLGVTITATKPDGTTQDVTEGVQALYDLVVQSMDWGSGFLTREDAEPVAAIARFCGFTGIEEAERYLTELDQSDAIKAALQEGERLKGTWLTVDERVAIHERVRKNGYPKDGNAIFDAARRATEAG